MHSSTAFLMILLAAAACGPTPHAGASPATSLSAAPCTGTDGQTFDITSPDGYVRHAAVYGSATKVVVIAHQSDQTRCDVVPIARWLRESGYAGVAVDLAGDWLGVLRAIVKEMRARGATSVQLLGASKGGCAAMIAGADITPAVSSVVSIGGERNLGGEFNADAAVARSHVPLFIVTSEDDGYLLGPEARILLAESASKDKKALILPGTQHGLELLDGPNAQQVKQAILAFLAAHA